MFFITNTRISLNNPQKSHTKQKKKHNLHQILDERPFPTFKMLDNIVSAIRELVSWGDGDGEGEGQWTCQKCKAVTQGQSCHKCGCRG